MRVIVTTLFAAVFGVVTMAQDAPADAGAAAAPAVCDLLTDEEAAAAFGVAAIREGRTADNMGATSCGWMATEAVDGEPNTVTFHLLRDGSAFGDLGQFYDIGRDAFRQGAEDLSGVGEKAFIAEQKGTRLKMYAAYILANGSLLMIDTSGIDHDKAVAIATRAGSRL